MLSRLDNLKQWHPEAPENITASVARLRRQLDEFDEAITAQRQLIALDGEIGPYRISLKHLQEERHTIHQELGALMRLRKFEAIGLALDGTLFNDHSAPLDVLRDVFDPFQGLYKRVYQAVTTGISRMVVPVSMANDARLSLAGLYDSSFGMIFTVRTNADLAGDSRVVNSLQRTLSVFDDTAITEETQSLGGWAVSSYHKLVQELNRVGARPLLQWQDPGAITHHWQPDVHTLYAVENRLAGIRETREETNTDHGVLIDAHKGKLTFELKLKKGTLKGRFSESQMDKIEPLIWKECRVKYLRTIILDSGEGRERSIVTLKDIDAA